MDQILIQIKQGSVPYCHQCGKDLKDNEYAMLYVISEEGYHRADHYILKCLKCATKQEG